MLHNKVNVAGHYSGGAFKPNCGSMLFTILKWLLLSIITLTAFIIAFILFAPTFGAKPTSNSMARMNASKHYQDGSFINIERTQVDTRKEGESMGLAAYLFPAKDKNPNTPLPSIKFEKDNFTNGDFVWFGHSSLMFRSNDINVLIDPVFNRASPIPIGGAPFDMKEPPSLDVLPIIDVVLISHDHYDHLDHITIGDLGLTTKLFLVPLGIEAHLLRWGVPAENIIELDWYESHQVGDSVFTLTPSRHFSGRGMTNRFSTLWGSWVFKSSELSVFLSGDSGYSSEFKRIGERFGPFDISFIENGAYNAQWAQIHMTPEQSVQAAIDLNTRLFFPIHWGKFDLAKHRWTDPIERAVKEANTQSLPIVAPLIGQIFRLNDPPFSTWWEPQ